MLSVKKQYENEWQFMIPDNSEVMEELYSAIDMMEDGLTVKPDNTFRKLLEEYPWLLDAAHHLALSRLRQGDGSEALYWWEYGVDMGRRAIPLEFQVGRDLLPWEMIDNRPFLRCLDGLATARMGMDMYGEAMWLYREILLLNPRDNLGSRYLLGEVLLKLDNDLQFLELYKRYSDDGMPEFLYGRVLANYRLGNLQEAAQAFWFAEQKLPLVAKELKKKRHTRPKDWEEGFVSFGGEDQAYSYWLQFGQLWKQSEALDWLREGANFGTTS